VASSLPGDANGDGVVDAVDYIAVKQHIGTTTGATTADGDFDGDGDVDWADLSTLTAALNAGGAGGTTVPEPATLCLLATGAFAAIRRRRQA
jgi:hypothetical protein